MNNYKTYFFYFLLVGGSISFIFMMSRYAYNGSNKNELQIDSVKKVSIALFHPSSSSTVSAIIQGFKEELSKEPHLQCSYTVYDHGGDKMMLRSDIEEVVNKDYDLIFTIGHFTSAIAAEITRKKGCRIPVVFAAVEDPVNAGVVPKDRDHTCFITGSSSEVFDQYEQGFALLLLLKPDLKRLLIPYNPTWAVVSHQRNVANVEAYMLCRGISVKKIEILSVKECLAKIAAIIQEGDVIWASRDASIMANLESIASLASRYDAMVYASSFGAIAQGAAFSFSADDKGSGTNAGKKAREILVDEKHPSHVAITPAPYNPYFWINRAVLKSQKIEIDPRLLFLIENTGIAAGYSH